MKAANFDSLTYANRLKAAGMDGGLAEVQASALTEVIQDHFHSLSTKQEGRIRAVGGLFWEKREIMATTDWQYKSVPECVVGGPGSCFQPLDPSVALKFQSASVNHRYLEPHLRLPEAFRDLEGSVREALRLRLGSHLRPPPHLRVACAQPRVLHIETAVRARSR